MLFEPVRAAYFISFHSSQPGWCNRQEISTLWTVTVLQAFVHTDARPSRRALIAITSFGCTASLSIKPLETLHTLLQEESSKRCGAGHGQHEPLAYLMICHIRWPDSCIGSGRDIYARHVSPLICFFWDKSILSKNAAFQIYELPSRSADIAPRDIISPPRHRPEGCLRYTRIITQDIILAGFL